MIKKGHLVMIRQDVFNNPTNEQRHQLLQDALTRAGRPEDYENVLELLSPPSDIYDFARPGTLKNTRIGIIGGGLAGLSAAYELRKLGANITIFDAEADRIGGRVYTYYFDKSKKYFGEFGALRIPVSHETTWHYINLFQLNTQSLASPASNNFIYAHQTRIRRDLSGDSITEALYPKYDLTETEAKTPWPELRDYAFSTMLNSLSPKMRTEILKILPEYSNQYAGITKLSNRQVFEMLELSQGAISLISAVEPLTGALLNRSHDQLMSSLYSLDFANVYKIDGGMVLLPMAFYKSLMKENPPEYQLSSNLVGRVTIKLGHIVNGLSKSLHTDKITLRYSNLKGKAFTDTFDYVVCTIPYSTLREMKITPLFSDQKMQAIKELWYLDAQKTLFLCRQRFWEEDTDYGRINGGISFTDLPIQSILYPSDHIRCEEPKTCSFKDPGVLTASYNLGQDPARVSNQSPQRRFELIKQNVEAVHGLPAKYLDTLVNSHKTVHWSTQQWARGGFALSGPGQKVNFSYAMLQPEYNNRVFFAGEHVSTKQGWMQGSLYTGKAAANGIALQASTP
ncbi:flavin monoamine oxidase family protein [Cellulosilyticum sp. I15G10I2]|uniref:flavin monoamine oxidase family protein n=1 Tax=Cellulosilyticum sp. I15G10I2 TaxID=1892843 RepID=UPI001FA7B015|nr:NAD(P)/FAD-dependent oxidoreductase [Cellulosilyticum sp. I15G10I2]